MRDDLIRRLVIVGGGTAGWMTAAAAARVMGELPGFSIELVESDAIGTIGVGEATIPEIQLFNQLLGIDEDDFIRATNGTYKLGIEFVDWTRIGDRYVHPFGFYGIDMKGVEFHQHWIKGRTLGDRTPLDAYSIGSSAGYASKFLRARPDLPNSPLSRIRHAYQFDAGLYARYLRGLAEGWGVTRTEGKVVEVEQDGETGHVMAVRLEGERRVEGDFFIDCTGFRGILIEQTLHAGFEDWGKWLPCDRAIAIPCESDGDEQPLTRATARSAGWQWRIPLQHRVGNGYVYASDQISDDEALDTLLASLGGAPLAEPNRLRFRAGYRKRSWIGNVVAIGLSGGFLEPLESTSIHLIQSQIARLMTLFPTRRFAPAEADYFNRATIKDYVDIRDFLVLHYRSTERDDSDFWRYCRSVEPPDGLAEAVAMFRANGRIFRGREELFTPTSWLAVLVGQGVVPESYHPACDLLSDGETLTRLRHIREVVADTVRQMPSQREFFRMNGSESGQRLRQVS